MILEWPTIFLNNEGSLRATVGGGGGGERVCGSADMAKNFLRIAYFNKNFSVSADPINLMDSPDFGQK